jgi:hypothetical protein
MSLKYRARGALRNFAILAAAVACRGPGSGTVFQFTP